MPIYHYDGTQKTPKNYVGFRVAVSVNGKLRQKWYKDTKELPAEAKQLEREWKFEQQLYKSSKVSERKERAQNSAYITGVSGIKMKFISIKKQVAGKVTYYYTPVFIVSGSNNNKSFIRNFNIKTLGFDMAWFKACQYAAVQYEMSSFDKILARKPSVEQFHIIYRWQTKKGLNIPFYRMPNELLPEEERTKTKAF